MKLKIAIAVLIAAFIGAFFYFDVGAYLNFEQLKAQKEALADFYADNSVLLPLGYFLLYIIVAAFALPAAAVITVAGGALFGFWFGLLLVSFASSIGATCAFLLTRYLFHDSVEKKFGSRLKTINEGIERDGVIYVLGLRLLPIFPFFVVNSVLALTKLNTATFYWASQVGMLAGTAVFVYAGTQLAQVDSLGDILSPQLWLAFILLFTFSIITRNIFAWVQKKRGGSVPVAEVGNE